MRSEPDVRLTDALTEVLEREASEVQVTPGARARLHRRLEREAAPGRARRRAWRGPLAAALGLVLVAVVALGVGRGWSTDAVPAPAVTPTPAVTPASSTTAPATPSLVDPALPTTLVYYPGPGGRLLGEPRLRTSLAAAVAEVGREPSSDDVSWPFGSMNLASVVERDGIVVVDYSRDDGIRPGKPDRAVATFWAQSLVHTVSAYAGRPTPVRVTFRGAPFELFDHLDTSEPFAYAQVDEGLSVGLALPTAVPGRSPVAAAGAVGVTTDEVRWAVLDLEGTTVLASGTAPVRDRTYGFSLAAAPGEYRLRVAATTSGGEPSVAFFEVER